jgi:AcrR family transcriptional regulator
VSVFAKKRRGRPRNAEKSPEFEEKLAAIVEAAANVFREKGYASGSLDDVAAALDIRKATLYYYIDSKAKLLEMIFERGLSTARRKIDSLAEITDPKERLQALIRHQIEIVSSDRGHFAVFFDHLSVSDKSEAKSPRLRALEKEYMESFLRIVESAVKAGVIADVPSKYAVQAIIGMTCWTYKWFEPTRHNAEAMYDTCVRLLIRK